MHYVYILKSVNFPEKTYIGYTKNIKLRLSAHNDGSALYSVKYKPWILHGYIAFQNEEKAIAFEKYLKTGSGKSFIKKRFL